MTLQRAFELRVARQMNVAIAYVVRRGPEQPERALRWEPSRGGEPFPHLYGSLSVAYVERVFDLPLDLAGAHALPEGR
jgi:uncharacterized protein (DUF952 family)